MSTIAAPDTLLSMFSSTRMIYKRADLTGQAHLLRPVDGAGRQEAQAQDTEDDVFVVAGIWAKQDARRLPTARQGVLNRPCRGKLAITCASLPLVSRLLGRAARTLHCARRQ